MSPFNTEDKTFRIMRLTFIALFVFSFSLLASVHSQTMRININANNESTHSILEQIEQQTDYLFIYNTNEIDLNRKASVHAQRPNGNGCFVTNFQKHEYWICD